MIDAEKEGEPGKVCVPSSSTPPPHHISSFATCPSLHIAFRMPSDLLVGH